MSFDTGKGWGERKPLPRVGRMKQVSAKRAKTNAVRSTVVRGHFGQRPACQACLPLQLIGIDRSQTGCDGWATDAHEILSRARSGRDDNLTDVSGIRPVSRACHSWLDSHPVEAEDAGLALPSGPVTQPLRQIDPRTGSFPRVLR